MTAHRPADVKIKVNTGLVIDLLRAAGYTQEKLGQRPAWGIKQASVSKYLSNEWPISRARLEDLSTLLGVPAHRLAEFTPVPRCPTCSQVWRDAALVPAA